MRAVVSVGTGPRYKPMLNELCKKLRRYRDLSVFAYDMIPSHWPSHEDVPYGFKAYALSEAWEDASTLLWCDSSIVPVAPLEPLWELIEDQGYWFSENLPYGRMDLPAWNCGQWCSDAALEPLGTTREEAFGIPQVIGTAFGLNMRRKTAQHFFKEFLRLAMEKTAFRGPWRNDNHEASPDPRVLGHRHDQTVASVLAHQLGMKLTTPPDWIVDGIPATESTVLEIHR